MAEQILRPGEIVAVVGRELKPHHLCAYPYDFAGRYGGSYENCPGVTSEEPPRISRPALADLTAKTIQHGTRRDAGPFDDRSSIANVRIGDDLPQVMRS